MEIRVNAPGRPRAWSVTAPPGTTLGALAELMGIARAGAVAVDGRALAADLTLEDAGVVAGSLLGPAAPARGGPLELVIDEPGGAPPRRVPLGPGRYAVGRHPSVDVLILDPEARARHVDLWVGADGRVRVCPPGTDVRTAPPGAPAPPGVLSAGDELCVGGTRLRVEAVVEPTADPPTRRLVHHRPPRPALAPFPVPPAHTAPPAAPTRSATIRTLATMLVPSFAGVAVAAALRPELAALALLAPAGALVTWLVLGALDLHAHRAHRRSVARADDERRAADDRAAADVAAVLAARHPPIDEVAARIAQGDPRLWERRPAHEDFLRLPVGLGDVAVPAHDDAPRTVTAPIEIDLRRPVGITGDRPRAVALARSLVVQTAAHHGPSDVVVRVWTTDPGAWWWLRWLPHRADGDNSAVSDTDGEPDDGATPGSADAPHLLLVVDAGGLPASWRPAWRRALGRASGVVLAAAPEDLPEECRTVVHIGEHGADVRDLDRDGGTTVHELWVLDDERADDLAARLAPLRDPDLAAARAVPSSTGLLPLLGAPADDDALADVIAERWAGSRGRASLAAPLGVDAAGPVLVDLVEDGPHALVAGTTGSGKSELLRSLVLGLAASVDAEHLAFVLVDYKGGSAFDGLHPLPHVVDVVTDLDTVTAARALHGLEAEVLRRERTLREAGLADIAAYHAARRTGGVGAPAAPLPRLAIVVDEFATLGQELPSFVDALVDVAQRGRSLGIHLVLATQRPNGAVKDPIRTNANLRIALRVLDAHDSRDVLGVDDAAAIARGAKGRAIARLGAGELRTFQSAFTGGPVPRAGAAPLLAVPAGVLVPAGEQRGPAERTVLVDAVRAAHAAAGLAAPRRPWSDALPDQVSLARLDESVPLGTHALGLVDDVDAQVHRSWTWTPAGNLLVAGLAGSGATDALVTCAAIAARAPDEQRSFVYVLTASPAAFDAVAGLAHVGAVIAHDDAERVRRLLRMLAARVAEGRRGRGDGRDVLVLVDGIGVLRATYDTLAGVELLDRFERLVADGPAAGVRFAFTADHPADLGHRLDRSVSRRLLLRLADRSDYAVAGVRDLDPASLPRGRGIDAATGQWVQLARLDAADAGALANLAAGRDGEAAPAGASAPAVGVLPGRVDPDALPVPGVDAAGVLRVALGIGERELMPVGVALAPGEHLLVVGGPRSGKSALLTAIAGRARSGGVEVVEIGAARTRGTRVHRARDAVATTVDALMRREPADRVLLLVDDADAVDDGGALERLLAAAPDAVHVVAAARADRLRSLYRHWTVELRRGADAVLLRGDDHDADLVGARLPRGIDATRPGCGWLVRAGDAERCQFAFAAPEAGVGRP